ncbi:bacteriocin-like protein [Chryseobacterium sp. MYb264]|uniref:bacteriocin-like protein n=1 Tax=Chryseobacterium sp. MYb264 TaxID=2745153 RepID=UPI003FA39ACD
MKKLKKLSREQLKNVSGGGSCTGTCSDGSFVYVSSCTSCISYSGGAACYNSHEESIYVETC